MHLLASAVVTIACSRAKAFDYAANLVNFADWFPGVNSVAAHNELPFATAGKQYVETAAMPLRGKRSVLIRVIDARAPHRVITEGDLAPLLPRMEIEFRDVASNNCEVSWRMLSRNENFLIRWTMLPFAGWVMGRRARSGLRNLKQRLEGGFRQGS